MKEAVDTSSKTSKASFRRNKSCADQIASLSIIMEQSLEWNSSLYISFIDYKKAFNSVERETMQKLLSPRDVNLLHLVHLSGHELQGCPPRPAV